MFWGEYFFSLGKVNILLNIVTMLGVLIGLLGGFAIDEIYNLQKSAKKKYDENKSKLSDEDKKAYDKKYMASDEKLSKSEPAMIVKHDGKDAGMVKTSGEISLDKNDIDKARSIGVPEINTPPPPPKLPSKKPENNEEVEKMNSIIKERKEYTASVLGQLKKFDKSKLKKAEAVHPSTSSITAALSNEGVIKPGVAIQLSNVPPKQQTLNESLKQAFEAKFGGVRGDDGDDSDDSDNEWE